jgi:glycosyltransferase involved in cell wall biosynthesis
VHPSPLQRLPYGATRLRRHYLPLYRWAVDHLRVRDCDLLLSTSSAVMKSIRPPHGVPHLCYCHSPARYIWEQQADYAHGEGGRLRRTGLRMVSRRFREWDRATASRVTRFIANSAHTARRIARCYDRDAVVIHPPVRTTFFTPDAARPREDWLLVVAALEPYKRTDLVIDAALRLNVPLRIVGDGTQQRTLRDRATSSPAIEFLGRVDDESLRDLYRTARALVFPQEEDFGIIAAEAQACGCPVIAYRAGGALDIITPQTGVTFASQTVDDACAAIERLDASSITDDACAANAQRFGEERFDAAIRREVETLLKG